MSLYEHDGISGAIKKLKIASRREFVLFLCHIIFCLDRILGTAVSADGIVMITTSTTATTKFL